MTSEVESFSFVVDLMDRSDIVKLVRAAESNCALGSKLDILMTIWPLTRAGNTRGKRTLKEGVDRVHDLARSNVNLASVEEAWEKWEIKRERILADVRNQASGAKNNKHGYRVPERSHIQDVARLEVAYGVEDAVVYANLKDVISWYTWPTPRKELLLYHLHPKHDRSGQQTTLSGTKRAANDSADDSKEQVEERMAKRVCLGARTSIEQQSIIMLEAGCTPDTISLTSGAGVQHPIVQPTWTGNGEASALVYDGQFDISGSTDRWIHYRWNAISAVDAMSLTTTLPTSSDTHWLYYNVNRSEIQKLPFAALSRTIQQSRHWIQEGEQGLTVSTCLCLAFPRGPAEDYGASCRLVCIVPGVDAPEVK